MEWKTNKYLQQKKSIFNSNISITTEFLASLFFSGFSDAHFNNLMFCIFSIKKTDKHVHIKSETRTVPEPEQSKQSETKKNRAFFVINLKIMHSFVGIIPIKQLFL